MCFKNLTVHKECTYWTLQAHTDKNNKFSVPGCQIRTFCESLWHEWTYATESCQQLSYLCATGHFLSATLDKSLRLQEVVVLTVVVWLGSCCLVVWISVSDWTHLLCAGASSLRRLRLYRRESCLPVSHSQTLHNSLINLFSISFHNKRVEHLICGQCLRRALSLSSNWTTIIHWWCGCCAQG